jgi:hypothetical protein
LLTLGNKGTKFFYENGTQFFIKGVAYQQDSASAGQSTGSTTYTDPLSDSTKCTRDVPILAALGTNVIRTYAVDPTADHSACMTLLSNAGIYVISDMSDPTLSINRDDPSWNVDLYTRYKGVIDNLGQYDNTIGFFAGNEVTNSANNTGASAFVKAAVRDSKAYIATKQAAGGRWMGVGYAANDDSTIRAEMAQYFNCGNQSQAIDFWGYNIYSWCDPSTFTTSGYDTQVSFFSNFSVPVFFAEYGCNTPNGAEGRTWEETTALYSSEMTDVFSGGIVYMYFEETNDFGLVSVSGDDVSTMDNYNNLKTKLKAVSPSSTSSAAYTATNTAQACPAVGTTWQAASVLPPTPDSALCDCMFSSLSCAPASGLSTSGYGTMFSYICGAVPSACSGILSDTTTGVYGPYVGCNSTHQLGAVLNAYYLSQNSAATACDFSGNATVIASPKSDTTCAALISSASAAAAVAATATGAGTSSSANPASTMRMERVMSMGDFAVGAYLLIAMTVGAGMIVL